MKILHYSLGLPPYRTGGLTKYSIDLMISQVEAGHSVNLLYPGQINPVIKKTKIKSNDSSNGISIFELINPLPVPLLGGITNPSIFMEKLKEQNAYHNFLSKLQPDIIHFHTLMGIHDEFLILAKSMGVKLIFSSHDYYGICPKVNLIDHNGNACRDYDKGLKCETCNLNSYSLPLIYLMQSHLYKTFKNNKIISKLKSNKKQRIKENNIRSSEENKNNKKQKSNGENFIQLRNYYLNMLIKMDKIHFNSEISKQVYEQHLTTKSDVISITHSDIKDNRVLKKYDKKIPLQIGFLGPIDKYKGFPLLRNSLIKLLEEDEYNWHLHVYGNAENIRLDKDREHITFYGRYEHKDLTNIFNKIDILVIPSIWKETFGFIGLEALSHGVPAIVSSYVGFKDLVKHNSTGLIVDPVEEQLSAAIKYAIHNRDEIKIWNSNICSESFSSIMKDHHLLIEGLYDSVLGEKK
ncbi:glycosyltransferase [Fictibacillus sp. UD]|uniref:glycosyltransferase n=1 Tax=Fictibacillus sp. UD TaxID=3038777 RepID=UPI003745A48D